MFLGGWLSFNGEMGKGGWGRTQLREVLPCECLDVEDLRESTEGFVAEAVISDHPVLNGIDLSSMPPVLGFNIVKPRAGCEVWQVGRGKDLPPLLLDNLARAVFLPTPPTPLHTGDAILSFGMPTQNCGQMHVTGLFQVNEEQ